MMCHAHLDLKDMIQGDLHLDQPCAVHVSRRTYTTLISITPRHLSDSFVVAAVLSHHTTWRVQFLCPSISDLTPECLWPVKYLKFQQ